MRRRSLLLILPLLAALALVHWSGNRADAQPQAEKDDCPDPKLVGYGVGFYLGQEVRDGIETDAVAVEIERIIEGFADGLRDADPDVEQQALDDVLAQVHKKMQQRMVERLLEEDEDFRKLHDENLARSLAYLEANAEMEGVVTRPSGVQYRVLVEGAGPVPGAADAIVGNFVARLVDGPVYASGENFEIEVADMLPGTRELITLMPVGSKWEVAIPPDLAYGAGGGPPNIGPNETLIAEIELVAIK